MAVTLTPEQQAKLDQFQADAAAASQAKLDSDQADAALLAATDLAGRDRQIAVDDLHTALQSAQAFIDSMIPPTRPMPVTAPAGK